MVEPALYFSILDRRFLIQSQTFSLHYIFLVKIITVIISLESFNVRLEMHSAKRVSIFYVDEYMEFSNDADILLIHIAHQIA